VNQFEMRTIVTGVDENGKAVFVSDEPTKAIEVGALPGTKVWATWGTPDGKLVTGRGASDFTFSPVFPTAGGTRFMITSWAPMATEAGPEPTEEQMAALFAEAEEKLPGLLPQMEPDSGGFHTTETIDYAVLLDGELVLMLDDGEERTLTPGTCVVQRGTRHCWQNRTDKPAIIMYVLIGAERPV